jgi:serine/threonine protein kinase
MCDDMWYALGVRFKDVYELGDKIGEGGFGAVFRCRHLKTNDQYACMYRTVPYRSRLQIRYSTITIMA